MISLLLPTRKRAALLNKVLRNVLEQAADPDQIEILLKVDSDDLETQALIPGSPKQCKWLVSDRGTGYVNFNLYVNELCKIATGDWLWLYNDDLFIFTKGWDRIFEEVRKRSQWPNPCVIHFWSPTAWQCFPMMSRDLYQTVGCFSRSGTCDSWVTKLGEHAKIQWLVREIEICHLRETGMMIGDTTFTETQSLYSALDDDFRSALSHMEGDVLKVNSRLKELGQKLLATGDYLSSAPADIPKDQALVRRERAMQLMKEVTKTRAPGPKWTQTIGETK